MTDKLMAVAASLVLIGFLAILIIWVPSVDLILVVALTVSLVLYDVWTSAFKDKS